MIIKWRKMKIPKIYAGIFVNDVPKTTSFFKQVLDANAKKIQPDLHEINVGSGRLLISKNDTQNSSIYEDSTNKALEIGFWVDNIEIVHKKVSSFSGYTTTREISKLTNIKENSGIKDFRFKLPEGYYVRISTDATSA